LDANADSSTQMCAASFFLERVERQVEKDVSK